MEMLETKNGLMFNLKTPCNKNDPQSAKWIRAIDIIGLNSWMSDNGSYVDRKQIRKYSIRVNFTIGKGINGTDSTIEVTQETYNAVAEYLGIPVAA